MSDFPSTSDKKESTWAQEPTAASQGQSCDFCGDVVPSVRRVALDRGYDRLQRGHTVQFACPACSERKERDRLGLDR
jgi:hypothetical protein